MSTDLDQSGGGESSATLGVCAVVTVLAVVSVALRFYTRIFTRAGLWWDDWLTAMAMMLLLVTEALILVGTSVAPHAQSLPNITDVDYRYSNTEILNFKLAFIASVLYFSVAGATKLAILLMYHRIFSANKRYRWYLVAAAGLVVAFWVGCTVANLTNCIPLDWAWKSNAGEKYCFNFNVFWMATGVCEIVLDVMILTLPVHFVMMLQLSLRKRITVASVFLLGGFVVVTGMLKTILGYLPGSRMPSYSKTEIWTTVHTAMSIVCASLPILWPFVKRVAEISWWSKVLSLLRISYPSSTTPKPKGSPETVNMFPTHGEDIEEGVVAVVKRETSDVPRRNSVLRLSALRTSWVGTHPDGSTMFGRDVADALANDHGIDIRV